LANAVPLGIQICSTIDLSGAGKIVPGALCRPAECAGQNLPLLGIICRVGRQFVPVGKNPRPGYWQKECYRDAAH
jgi:hypothetical protein